MKRDLAIPALLIFSAVVVAGGALWRLTDQRPQSAPSPPSTAVAQDSDGLGGPFSLIDQNGMRRSDMDFRGKYMLVFFGYTFCPDLCPTTLAVEAEALDQIGASASRITPIFISVDPMRDTPEKLKAYLAAFDAKPPSARLNFVGLTGSDEDIAKVAASYRVYYKAHLDGFHGTDYAVDHTSNVYLMSPEGKFIAYYSPGILPDEMAADLKRKTPPR